MLVGGPASGGSAGPVGVWNGTNIKLFSVHMDGKREGPSLSKPRGAVDAVGSRLVQGVQGLGLGSVGRGFGSGAAGGGAREQSVREV